MRALLEATCRLCSKTLVLEGKTHEETRAAFDKITPKWVELLPMEDYVFGGEPTRVLQRHRVAPFDICPACAAEVSTTAACDALKQMGRQMADEPIKEKMPPLGTVIYFGKLSGPVTGYRDYQGRTRLLVRLHGTDYRLVMHCTGATSCDVWQTCDYDGRVDPAEAQRDALLATPLVIDSAPRSVPPKPSTDPRGSVDPHAPDRVTLVIVFPKRMLQDLVVAYANDGPPDRAEANDCTDAEMHAIDVAGLVHEAALERLSVYDAVDAVNNFARNATAVGDTKGTAFDTTVVSGDVVVTAKTTSDEPPCYLSIPPVGEWGQKLSETYPRIESALGGAQACTPVDHVIDEIFVSLDLFGRMCALAPRWEGMYMGIPTFADTNLKNNAVRVVYKRADKAVCK